MRAHPSNAWPATRFLRIASISSWLNCWRADSSPKNNPLCSSVSLLAEANQCCRERCGNCSRSTSEGRSPSPDGRFVYELRGRRARRATSGPLGKAAGLEAAHYRILLECIHDETTKFLVAAITDHVARRNIAEERILGPEPESCLRNIPLEELRNQAADICDLRQPLKDVFRDLLIKSD